MMHSDSSLFYAWLIPLFPLIGFLINGVLGPLTGKPLPKVVAGAIGTVAVFASFVVAVMLFLHVTGAQDGQKQATVYLAPWLNIPTDAQGIHFFNVNYELLIDPLSVLMMLIITGVGGLIHLYSTAYMADRQRVSAVLHLPELVCVLHADARNEQQHFGPVHRLGGRRPLLLSLDRLLLREEVGR